MDVVHKCLLFQKCAILCHTFGRRLLGKVGLSLMVVSLFIHMLSPLRCSFRSPSHADSRRAKAKCSLSPSLTLNAAVVIIGCSKWSEASEALIFTKQ